MFSFSAPSIAQNRHRLAEPNQTICLKKKSHQISLFFGQKGLQQSHLTEHARTITSHHVTWSRDLSLPMSLGF
jgi:hypothetical protein